MIRFSHLPLSLLCLVSPLLAQQKPAMPAPNIAVKAVTDHADALYKVGETATFEITASSHYASLVPKEVVCHFSKDGVDARPAQKISLQNGKGTITGSLDEPGFLLLRVTIPNQKQTALASAGFDPQKITPSLPIPDDFDAFWTQQKKALAAVPMKSTLTPVTSPVKTVDAFDVQVDCLGAPVSGYFGKPKDAKPKSLPIILFVHGAGVRGSGLANVFWAEREGGMLAMDINAHGLPNGKPDVFYSDQAAGPLKDYRYVGREDREKSYFKGMFLRLVRALDFLTAQPEWDGKTVIVYGGSQGGFQAFAAGALDERVTFICAGVPAGCDHTGVQVGRINGWPKLVPNDASGKPDEAVLQASRYFDNVNFAQRCHAKGAAVTVGFIDTVCPPTGIYAAYNALTIPKSLHTDVLSGHTSTQAANRFLQEAAYDHVRKMK